MVSGVNGKHGLQSYQNAVKLQERDIVMIHHLNMVDIIVVAFKQRKKVLDNIYYYLVGQHFLCFV